MSENAASFTTSFRGYDRSEVERTVSDLTREVETLRQSNSGLRAEIEQAEAKNRELTNKIKSLPDRPNFANLGAQFEEVLRLGEEKAQRLVADALEEAAKIRQRAEADVAKLERDAALRAEQVYSDAQARANELRLTSESAASNVTTQASGRLSEASEILSTARLEAAAIIAEAEREIAASRTKLQRDMESERAALAELAEKVANDRLAAEEAIRVRQEEAEQENLRSHQEAVLLSTQLLSEANRKAEEVALRTNAIAVESEEMLRSARATSEAVLEDSRQLSSGIIEHAQTRAKETSEATREHVEALLSRALRRIDSLREEREIIEQFTEKIREVRSTDALIAEIEESLRNENSQPGSGAL